MKLMDQFLIGFACGIPATAVVVLFAEHLIYRIFRIHICPGHDEKTHETLPSPTA